MHFQTRLFCIDFRGTATSYTPPLKKITITQKKILRLPSIDVEEMERGGGGGAGLRDNRDRMDFLHQFKNSFDLYTNV